jgi:hypothetical protein
MHNQFLINPQQEQPIGPHQLPVNLPPRKPRPMLTFCRWCARIAFRVFVLFVFIMCVLAGLYLALLVVLRAVALVCEALGL